MGRPIIQPPEDIIRTEEAICQEKPDVAIESGIAHGESLISYASLFKAMKQGRVIGADFEIQPKNRAAIEAHPLSDIITMIVGSSIDQAIVSQVRKQVRAGERGLAILDSNRTPKHVLGALSAYAEFVAVGSYLMICDGIMQDSPHQPGMGDGQSPVGGEGVPGRAQGFRPGRAGLSLQRRRDSRTGNLMAQRHCEAHQVMAGRLVRPLKFSMSSFVAIP